MKILTLTALKYLGHNDHVWERAKLSTVNGLPGIVDHIPGDGPVMPPHFIKMVDWSEASIEDLIAHITVVHHHNARHWLNDAFALMNQNVSSLANPRLDELSWKLRVFSSDMRMHFDQEEAILFPACIALDKEMQTKAHVVDDASILRDIHIMSDGHASAREKLAELIELSLAISPLSHAAIVNVPHILRMLDVDLLEHERLEDEILLPAVLFQLDLSKSMHTSGPFNYTDTGPIPGEDK